MPTLVTDPNIIAQMTSPATAGGGPTRVTDPDIVAQMTGTPVVPDAHRGVIERPGQPTPTLMQQPGPPPPPGEPGFGANFAAASPIAANAALSAAGGPVGAAPYVAGGLATLGSGAGTLATKFAPKALDYAKDVAKLTGAGLVLEHLPGGEKIMHIFHAAGGEGGGEGH